MSPLIEEARRRQRRRRIMLGAVLLVAAGAASALALYHSSAPSQRQAQSRRPAVVIRSLPGGFISPRLAKRGAVEPATVLRALVTRYAHGRAGLVTIDPRTGTVTLMPAHR